MSYKLYKEEEPSHNKDKPFLSIPRDKKVRSTVALSAAAILATGATATLYSPLALGLAITIPHLPGVKKMFNKNRIDEALRKGDITPVPQNAPIYGHARKIAVTLNIPTPRLYYAQESQIVTRRGSHVRANYTTVPSEEAIIIPKEHKDATNRPRISSQNKAALAHQIGTIKAYREAPTHSRIMRLGQKAQSVLWRIAALQMGAALLFDTNLGLFTSGMAAQGPVNQIINLGLVSAYFAPITMVAAWTYAEKQRQRLADRYALYATKNSHSLKDTIQRTAKVFPRYCGGGPVAVRHLVPKFPLDRYDQATAQWKRLGAIQSSAQQIDRNKRNLATNEMLQRTMRSLSP